jgi:LmbE family N-acetylglucosaminyl deacetylase
VVLVEERSKWQSRRAAHRMLTLDFSLKCNDPLVVLCLGAHSDDIEIGCGGTLLGLKQVLPQMRFHWVVLSASGIRAEEAAKAADAFACGRDKTLDLKNFRDGFMPYLGAEVKTYFEDLKKQVSPDLIFTHWQNDAHQDHRLVSELTWNTFRNHLILEYEIPKYDGDVGRPNFFFPLAAPLYEQKIDYLFDAFKSQHSKPWFDRQTFLGLMRIRGVECNSPSGYAEAFHARKVTLSPTLARRDLEKQQ